METPGSSDINVLEHECHSNMYSDVRAHPHWDSINVRCLHLNSVLTCEMSPCSVREGDRPSYCSCAPYCRKSVRCSQVTQRTVPSRVVRTLENHLVVNPADRPSRQNPVFKQCLNVKADVVRRGRRWGQRSSELRRNLGSLRSLTVQPKTKKR